MLVYSKKIIQFVNEIKSIVKEVLSGEIGVKVHGNRFYDRQMTSYPIKVVIFNANSMLGYFEADFYELGFHETLMHSSKELLRNVIRHELAHYMTFIHHGATAKPHSEEFRAFCQKMGWGEEVYRAAFRLDEVQRSEESGIFRKVQKLMALSASSNKNEAELAMIKSQQLLMKHNLDSKYIGEEEKIVLKRIMKQKKTDAKMEAISRILQTFFVNVVYNRGSGFTYLEILGSEVNVEIAEYVASVLQAELDKLWSQAQRESFLRGAVAKNSFFRGLAKGYCNKIQALKREYTSDVTRSLMVIEKQLTEAKEMVYPRLITSKSSRSHCREASQIGEQMGRQLNINPALNRSPADLIGYLS